MFALCGVLGGNEHWADAAAAAGRLHAQRRSRSTAGANAPSACASPIACCATFGMRVSDWQGTSFLLSTRTGKTEIIADLGHLWPAAERLSGRVCDPLAPDLIERLEPRDD